MARVHNFSAGPAALPERVLREAQSELLDFAGSGMSVLEMSHRSPVYQAVIDEARRPCADCSSSPRTTVCCSCRAARPCSSRAYR